MSTDAPLRTERKQDGAVLHLVLNRPPGNILDAAMIAALRDAVREAATDADVRALLFEGAGANFSFGASVEEHLPETVKVMLQSFHGLFRDLIDSRLLLLAAVQGQCLGGGLELASFCHRVFAARETTLGQAEINLGVIAPVGSFVLPRRIGQAHANDLLLTGRSVAALEAHSMGLVDQVTVEPRRAALDWVRAHLLGKSGASLRLAVEAARHEHDQAFLAHIEGLEELYMERLMQTEDAVEGIRAFLEKRPPSWSHA